MRFFLLLSFMLIPAPVCAQVVISEVLWAGSPVSSADEWLELTSVSTDTVSLAGWSLWRRASDDSLTEMIRFPDDAEIGAGALYLIANYDADASALSVVPDLVSTAVSLANTKLYLELRDAEDVVVDAVDDGVGEPFAGEKSPYASMERIDLNASGEDAENWRTAEVSIGFDEGVEVLGTPRGDSEETEESEGNSSDSSASSVSSESSIKITEVLTDPKGSDDYEWIEVGNLGESSQDITGWILSDGSRRYKVEPRSADGYVLKPQEYTLFFHHQTGISLTDDDVITLENAQGEVDRLALSEAGEEISVGRTPEGKRGLFCVPTPRAENGDHPPQLSIITQSGRSTDYTKVTLNLDAQVEQGSLKDAECFWDFDDGTTSEKCNPPSHTWDYYGVYHPKLTVTTRCGEEIEKVMDIVVLEERKPKNPKIEQKMYSTSSSSVHSSQVSKIEQKMYSQESQYSSESSVSSASLDSFSIPISYKNIPEFPSDSSDSSVPSVSFPVYPQPPRTTSSTETSLPWILLFSQSALWVLLATKRML